MVEPPALKRQLKMSITWISIALHQEVRWANNTGTCTMEEEWLPVYTASQWHE
jgi:hypothetical protein